MRVFTLKAAIRTLFLVFYLPLSNLLADEASTEEMRKKFALTRERIRQLQNIALAKLRRALSKKDSAKPDTVRSTSSRSNYVCRR